MDWLPPEAAWLRPANPANFSTKARRLIRMHDCLIMHVMDFHQKADTMWSVGSEERSTESSICENHRSRASDDCSRQDEQPELTSSGLPIMALVH